MSSSEVSSSGGRSGPRDTTAAPGADGARSGSEGTAANAPDGLELGDTAGRAAEERAKTRAKAPLVPPSLGGGGGGSGGGGGRSAPSSSVGRRGAGGGAGEAGSSSTTSKRSNSSSEGTRSTSASCSTRRKRRISPVSVNARSEEWPSEEPYASASTKNSSPALNS
jgi:hypothetical protein